MAPQSEAIAKPGRSWLGHPITVMVVGSLFSVFLIPWISARMNDTRLINDARLQQCIHILENSTETDQRLNTMITTFDMFIKDCEPAGRVNPEERQQIRAEMARQYRDFDRQAWWWFNRLPMEASLLRIAVDARTLRDDAKRYKDNLNRSTALLGGLWTECLRKDLRPDVTRMGKTAKQTRDEMDRLHDERQKLVAEMVHLFAPIEPTVQRLLSQPIS